MNTADAKRILETALICSTQPLPVRELRVLFDDELGADTIKSLLAELQERLGAARPGAGERGQRLALPEPARDARPPRPPAPREAAALHPRGARDAGHHCLPPAGHARRHGRHPRRDDQLADPQAARRPRLGRGDRPSRNRGPAGAVRDHAPVPRRPGPGVAGPVAADRNAGPARRRVFEALAQPAADRPASRDLEHRRAARRRGSDASVLQPRFLTSPAEARGGRAAPAEPDDDEAARRRCGPKQSRR